MIDIKGTLVDLSKDVKKVYKKCSCCNNFYKPNQFIVDEKTGIAFKSDYIVKEKNYCSFSCLNMDHLTYNNVGSIVQKEPKLKALSKFRHSVFIDNQTIENPFNIGFEIEKEDADLYAKLYDTGINIPPGWHGMIETSIKQNGIELVSPAYNFKRKDEIKKLFVKYSKLLSANTSNTCGGHISISKYGTTGKDLAIEYKTMIAFFLALYPTRMKNVNIRGFNFHDICKIEAKHKPIHFSGPRLEIRVISAVKNSKQLWRRFCTFEYFLYNNPSLNDTILSMQSNTGILKKLYKPVFGVQKWPEIINRFETFYNWFWDSKSSENSIYFKKIKKYMEADLNE